MANTFIEHLQKGGPTERAAAQVIIDLEIERDRLQTVLNGIIDCAAKDDPDSGWWSEDAIKAIEAGCNALGRRRIQSAPKARDDQKSHR